MTDRPITDAGPCPLCGHTPATIETLELSTGTKPTVLDRGGKLLGALFVLAAATLIITACLAGAIWLIGTVTR